MFWRCQKTEDGLKSEQESLQNPTRLQAASAGVYKLANLSATHKVKKKRKAAIFREMPKID